MDSVGSPCGNPPKNPPKFKLLKTLRRFSHFGSYLCAGLRYFFLFFGQNRSETVRIGLKSANNSGLGEHPIFLVETGRNGSKQAEKTSAKVFGRVLAKRCRFESPRPAQAGRGTGRGVPKKCLLSPSLSSTSLWKRGRNASCTKTDLRPRNDERKHLGCKLFKERHKRRNSILRLSAMLCGHALFQPRLQIPVFSFANIHIHTFTTSSL